MKWSKVEAYVHLYSKFRQNYSVIWVALRCEHFNRSLLQRLKIPNFGVPKKGATQCITKFFFPSSRARFWISWSSSIQIQLFETFSHKRKFQWNSENAVLDVFGPKVYEALPSLPLCLSLIETTNFSFSGTSECYTEVAVGKKKLLWNFELWNQETIEPWERRKYLQNTWTPNTGKLPNAKYWLILLVSKFYKFGCDKPIGRLASDLLWK